MTDQILFELTPEEQETQSALLWQELESRALKCRACPLCHGRKSVVFGEGNRNTSLLSNGEGPGDDEDEQGRPFVGRSGQFLTQILDAAGIARSGIYITNIVKCRPPENRTPLPEEMMHCDQYLQTQILLIRPAMLVLLGNTPTKWILRTTEGITRLRGRWFEWRGIPVMPMFHPSYLLRFPDQNKKGSPKHLTWLDIQEVKKRREQFDQTGSLEGITFG